MNKYELKQQVIDSMSEHGLYRAGSDNPILFTVEFYALCERLKIFNLEDAKRLKNSIDALQERPGLFNRRPGLNTKMEDHDNYVAIEASAYLTGLTWGIVIDIERYGQKNFYCYDNTRPNKWSLDGQRQGFDIFLYKVNAGSGVFHWLGINYLWFAGKIFFEFQGPGKEKDHTTSHMLSWLRFLTVGSSFWIKPIQCYWKKKMLDKYGEKWLYEIYKIYHGENSPLTKLAGMIDPKEYL